MKGFCREIPGAGFGRLELVDWNQWLIGSEPATQSPLLGSVAIKSCAIGGKVKIVSKQLKMSIAMAAILAMSAV